jgi:hypothetical protein
MPPVEFPGEDVPIILPGQSYLYTLWSEPYPGHEHEPPHDRHGLHFVGEYRDHITAQRDASQKAAAAGVTHVVKDERLVVLSVHRPPAP